MRDLPENTASGATRGRARWTLLVIGLFSLVVLAHSAVAGANSGEMRGGLAKQVVVSDEYDPDTLLVGFTHQVSALARASAHATVGATRTRAYSRIPVEVVRLEKGMSVEEAIERYSALPGVAFAEPNYLVYPLNIPNDPFFSDLWGLRNTGQTGGTPGVDIRALEAWETTTGDSAVIVGVIDTGIDYNHPDLFANMWVNEAELNGTPGVDDDGNGIADDIFGARWTDGDGTPTSGDPMDGNGHGTHVAGTIGAVGDNAFGVVGVNWNVRLMGLKFLRDDGPGATADAIAAIEYAIEMGAHLTNNSWGGGVASTALKAAIEAADAAGQLFVAAAGNNARNNDTTPFSPVNLGVPNIVGVASITHDDVRSSFSNFGPKTIHLAAPGSDIVSTWPLNVAPFGFHSISGTSMAAPHVAGVAALLLAEHPDASPAELKAWLLDGVAPRPGWENFVSTGGRLDAAESLRVASLPESALPVTDFEAVSLEGEDTVTLRWTLPVSPGLERVAVRRSDLDFPLDWMDGELLHEDLETTEIVDGPFPPGTRPKYSVWAIYEDDAVSARAQAEARVGGMPNDHFTETFTGTLHQLSGTVYLGQAEGPGSASPVPLAPLRVRARIGALQQTRSVDASGTFSFHLPSGNVALDVIYQELVDGPLNVPAPQTFVEINVAPLVNLVGDTVQDIHLAPFSRVHGRVSFDGAPVPLVQIDAFRSTNTEFVETKTLSDVAGSYEIWVLPMTHEFTATPPEGSGLAPFEIVADFSTDTELDVELTTLPQPDSASQGASTPRTPQGDAAALLDASTAVGGVGPLGFAEPLDLANKTLTLVPAGAPNWYAARMEAATDFPTDPAGGSVLNLDTDDFQEIDLNGEVVWLYGVGYPSFFVGSNGYITFGSGDANFIATLVRHFSLPRISPLFTDLDNQARGEISTRFLEDRAVVSYENVAEWGTNNSNSFQVEMFFDGTIRMTWLGLDAQAAIAGISPGEGLPLNFVESNLTGYPPLEPVPGDFNGDNRVDLEDLLIMLDGWGTLFGLDDLLGLLDNWGYVGV